LPLWHDGSQDEKVQANNPDCWWLHIGFGWPWFGASINISTRLVVGVGFTPNFAISSQKYNQFNNYYLIGPWFGVVAGQYLHEPTTLFAIILWAEGRSGGHSA
jgi:hypothetical protein